MSSDFGPHDYQAERDAQRERGLHAAEIERLDKMSISEFEIDSQERMSLIRDVWFERAMDIF